jgi:transposase
MNGETEGRERSGQGRVYVDRNGQLQYEYREPAPMNQKLVDFIVDCFYSANPHIERPEDDSEKRG